MNRIMKQPSRWMWLHFFVLSVCMFHSTQAETSEHNFLRATQATDETIVTEPCLLLIGIDSDENEYVSCVLGPTDAKSVGATMINIGAIDENDDLVLYQENDAPRMTKAYEKGDLRKPDMYLHAIGATITKKQLILPSSDSMRSSDSDVVTKDFFIQQDLKSSRSSTRNLGTKDVLVMTATFDDSDYPKTDAELSNAVFGTDGDPVNLLARMNDCSFDQITIVPVHEPADGIENGVIRLRIEQNIAGLDHIGAFDTMNAAAQALLGYWVGDRYDHVMFMIPPGTGGPKAMAWFNWWGSLYTGTWGLMTSFQMHEIGHNFGLHHSQLGGNQYGDKSGYMGISSSIGDNRQMCYNAANYVQMQWFPDREIALSQSEPDWYGDIYPTALYEDTTSSNKFIVYIDNGDLAGNNIYVSYNKAVGINSGTALGANRVLVHSKEGGLYEGVKKSYLLAQLAEGETYVIAGSGIPITFVSTGSDFAKVRVGEESGPTQSPVPTLSPTTSSKPTTVPINKVKVSYYIASGWSNLPDEGLKSLNPYKIERVENIDFRAGSGEFAGSGRVDDVAALFEGYLALPTGGESVELCITSDDGSKLYIDGTMTIDNDGVHGDRRVCETVSASGTEQISVEFFERGGGATMVVEWTLPSSSREVIPVEAWVDKPKLTPMPSPSPSSPPSPSPSSPPSPSPGCPPDLPKGKFWDGTTKIKNGKEKPKKRNCKWLIKKQFRINKFCAMMDSFVYPSGKELPPAREVCTDACDSCDEV